MQLKLGQKAPTFKVNDITGQSIDLLNYRGKKTLVCFLRYAGCPHCNLLLHGLIERYPKYKKAGLEIIVFIQSSREDIEEYPMKRQKPKPEFPIIADPERTIYDKYGVELSVTKAVRGLVKAPLSFSKLAKLHFPQGKIDGKLLLMPAFFLIQRDLSVYKPYYTVDFSTGVPDIDILDFLLYE